MKINSEIQFGEEVSFYNENIIKNETMLFSANYSFAMEHASEPTREFLNSLPDEWRNDNTIIDSRVHMLMPGWYPCIPGYHHDDVPRERSDGQPEYFSPSYRSEHAMVIYNGSICPTQFAIGSSEFEDIPLNKIYYKEWHKIVEQKIEIGELTSISCPENKVLFFNDRTWHQGTPAIKNGWRLFIRASRNTHRKVFNEIRRQVQVYMEDITSGW